MRTAGEKMLVSNGGTLKERIFLFENEFGEFVCVHKQDEDKYRNGEYFRVGIWNTTTEEEDLYSEFDYGQEILVSNNGEVFKKRIYLGKVDGRILTVHKEDEAKFEDNKLNFKTALWNIGKAL